MRVCTVNPCRLEYVIRHIDAVHTAPKLNNGSKTCLNKHTAVPVCDALVHNELVQCI